MAYTNPTTRSTGNLITASIWNTDMVENIKFLHDPPSARVKNSAVQSISNMTETALTFDGEDWDTDTMHSTSSNTSRITIVTAGKYRLWGYVQWASNSTGARYIEIRKNGSAVVVAAEHAASDNAEDNVAIEDAASVNDYYELRVWQSSGGALNATNGCRFGATWFSG